MRGAQVRPGGFFALLGYAVICTVVMALLLESGAFIVLTAYHRLRPDTRDNFADTSPAYDGYPWASEYWKEEKTRWQLQHGSYEPFRIWGVAPWHGKYVNTDDTPNGTWRRTINPVCGKKSRFDVWMFGGSTLYGTGAPDWATLPSFLSRELNSTGGWCVVVTNFGAEGYVTNQEVILLMEQLKADRHPDLVIFYDGVNDSYTGAVSPGIPKAHMSLSNIKARVEGTLGSRLDFLRNSYFLQLAVTSVNSFRRPGAANPNSGDVELKAEATLDNYETNLRVVRILGEADGFRVFCFWQPAFVYGHKPLAPFEIRIADNEATKNTFRILTAVYEQAGRRAAMDGTFAFLGEMFDSVKEPVYIDKWMHLSPTGNELVARSLAKAVEDGLKPSKLWGQPEGKSKRLPISQRASRSILPSKVSTKPMISGRSCFGELIEFPKPVKKSARNTLEEMSGASHRAPHESAAVSEHGNSPQWRRRRKSQETLWR